VKRIVVFPDTNVLLQCRALHELPWAHLLEVDEILLLIGAPVRDEIDRLKQDGNNRRAKRAREANSLFRRILQSTDDSVVVQEGPPRVQIRFAPRLRAARETPKGLDLRRADEQLIEEVLQYRITDRTARVLSDDTGLQLAARDYDVPVLAVPEDWKLRPENDERDRRILQLNAQITALKETEPAPVLVLTETQGMEIGAGLRRLPLYLDLSDEQTSQLTEAVKRQHPKAHAPDPIPAPQGPTEPQDLMAHLAQMTQAFASWSAPTPEQFDAYGKEYAKWVTSVQEYFKNLAWPLNAQARLVPLTITLTNPGSRGASDTLVELRVTGEVRFFASASDEVPELLEVLTLPRNVVPKPPDPPTTRMMGYLLGNQPSANASVWDLNNLRLPPEPRFRSPLHRDRHVFYRREDSDGPVVQASFTCAEFRHGCEAQTFRVWLVVPPRRDPIRAHLSCRVSASNLSRALELHQDFTFESDVQSALAVAENWRLE